MTLPSNDICYRALRSRDPAFDGRIFVGITSTGIYCRPICPARTAKPENCRFFPSAAAAQEAGFRPCLRCRPEISPDAAAWRGTSNTVSRALALIGEGLLDGEAGVEALAARLGVGERQLRRLFDQHLGAPPIAVAQTRRILFAKQLIQDTQLSMTDIAAASGFGSVRRFNDAFRKLYRRAPSELRKRRHAPLSTTTLKLGYRPPYDWDAIVAFLGYRAIEGVELVENGRYMRTIEIGGAWQHRGRAGPQPSRRHDPFSESACAALHRRARSDASSISMPTSSRSARIFRVTRDLRRSSCGGRDCARRAPGTGSSLPAARSSASRSR